MWLFHRFRQGTALSPTNLEAVGKTYNDLISTLTTGAKYDVRFIPAQHRENDMVELSMNKPLDSVFTVMEGDNGNIINLSGMECNPVSDYKNHSVGLFSRTEMVQEDEEWEEQQKYYYVVTRFPEQILRYNEMSVVTEVGDGVSDEEAYYTARKTETFGNHIDDLWSEICSRRSQDGIYGIPSKFPYYKGGNSYRLQYAEPHRCKDNLNTLLQPFECLFGQQLHQQQQQTAVQEC